MIAQLPYREIGIGIALLFGVWAFVEAENVRARALIAGIPVLVLFAGALRPPRFGGLISLIGWMAYGIGCLIYLKGNGMEVR